MISQNSITNNQLGGFVFKNVGENNPRVTFEKNNVEYNGVRMLNITAPGVLDFYVQNTKMLTISNNFLVHNAGGISVNTTTKDNEVALYANITNNVIMYNSHGEPLHLEGRYFVWWISHSLSVCWTELCCQMLSASLFEPLMSETEEGMNNIFSCQCRVGSITKFIS